MLYFILIFVYIHIKLFTIILNTITNKLSLFKISVKGRLIWKKKMDELGQASQSHSWCNNPVMCKSISYTVYGIYFIYKHNLTMVHKLIYNLLLICQWYKSICNLKTRVYTYSFVYLNQSCPIQVIDELALHFLPWNKLVNSHSW